MKKRTKTLLTVLCAAALIAASVFGTLAYLTATSGTVTNTFTAGKLIDPTDPEANKLKLLEHVAVQGENGKYTLSDDITLGNTYTVTPGNNLPKDPFITVKVDSKVKAFLFITVEDNLTPKGLLWSVDSAHWMELRDADGLRVVSPDGKDVYVYTTTDSDNRPNAARFTGELTAEQTNIIKDKSIPVYNDLIIDQDHFGTDVKLEFNAYLCQADGFDTAFDAWDACFGAGANP